MAIIAILAFLVFIVLFALAARYGVKYSGRILGAKIEDIHRAAEFILESKKVPPGWVTSPPSAVARTEDALRRQKRKALHRLKKMVKYMQRTPVFTDIESREYVIAELERIHSLWKDRELSDIT